jgi:hypothetical protein
MKRHADLRLGDRVRLEGKIVKFCDEPNTGLMVLEIENPEREGPWKVSIPIIAAQEYAKDYPLFPKGEVDGDPTYRVWEKLLGW